MKTKVHQLRAAAPDKFNIWTDGSYELIKHDNTNLVNFSDSELLDKYNKSEYILPADEGDIKYINKLTSFNESHEFILLPQVTIGYKLKVIDYDKFVPKNSDIYKLISDNTSLKYMPFTTVSVSEFNSLEIPEKCAIKTVTGSGSRGVILVDIDRLHLGGKYVPELTSKLRKDIIDFASNENCDIIIQELIPNYASLTKVNVDFIIRDGELLGYKWDITDPMAVFTNWNWGFIHRSEYTDRLMSEVSKFLISCGITNAIMNFEAFSDLKNETYLVEFNWRYSNSTFESQAENIDLIGCYLNKKSFEFPQGTRKFVRYWQCKYYDEIITN